MPREAEALSADAEHVVLRRELADRLGWALPAETKMGAGALGSGASSATAATGGSQEGGPAVGADDYFFQALAHRSWCAEHPGTRSNERLEFLGDAVLGLVVTSHLFRTYPDLPEGELAKVRASLVSSAALAEVAAELRIGDAMLLGKGENASGGREKPSILADATEALIGAVYLEGGWEAAETMVMKLLGDRIASAAAGPGGQDYKTRLQELCARTFDHLPVYKVSDRGPDHAKQFDATVVVRSEVRGRGHGRSKKQAEQAAAKEAWEALVAERGS